jgi:hypothetical protein
MIIKRVGVLSMGKVMGCVYAAIGLIAFGLVFLFMSLAAAVGPGRNQAVAQMGGVWAIIFAPVLYGVLGFLGGVLMAAIYNIAASLIGGIEIELSPQGSIDALAEGIPPRPRPDDNNPFSSPRT